MSCNMTWALQPALVEALAGQLVADAEHDILALDQDGAEDVEVQDLNELSFVDHGLSSTQVLGRIEEFVAAYVADLAGRDTPPELEITSRSRGNQLFVPAGAVDVGATSQCSEVTTSTKGV
jgi:hypothetical protein